MYPASVKTLADELTAGSLTWKAYVQDMEANAPAGVTCRRPELGAADPNQTPAPGDPYLTYRNPFVYFDSLLSEGACATDDVDLSQLQASLAMLANTPSFSWIVPSACNDGSSTSCAAGAPSGLTAADGGKAAGAASTAKKAAQAASTQPRHRPLPDLFDLGSPASLPGG